MLPLSLLQEEGINNAVSGEGDRAEVSSGSLQRSCSLTELMDC